MKPIFLFTLIFLIVGCQPKSKDNSIQPINSYSLQTANVNNDFKNYWYGGKAEITSYALEQSRYGEIHRGKGVFIFVTESFSKNKQVKLDAPDANPNDKVSVLKMNATRKFNTGIYPYSTMQSVFTPVKFKDHPFTLKVATASQEWCGHTFEQLNLKNNHYDHQLFSYFESEGDKSNKLEKAWLEDELFNRIRLQPDALPKGEIKIIPGTIFSRFKHVPLSVEKGIATMEVGKIEGQIQYEIKYPNLGRTLTIYFQKEFPYLIESWEESLIRNPDLVTRASRIKTIKLDYWNKNGTVDLKYRKELGLE